MNRPWGLIYTLSALVVLLGLSIVFVLRLNTAREANIRESQASYDHLSLLLSEENDLFSVAEVLDDYFGDVEPAVAVALYYPRQGMVFLRARQPSLMQLGREELQTFEGFPVYDAGEVSWMLMRKAVQLGSEDDESIYLDVLYRIVTFEDIYPLLRDTLISLLLFAILLIAVALIAGRGEPDQAPTHSAARSTTGTPDLEPDHQPDVQEASEPVSRTMNPLIVPETHATDADRSPETNSEEIEVEEVPADETPAGSLFDPMTGLSYEQHLNRKLGLELERAAYNDQDLSCMIISFDRSNAAAKRSEWAQHILDAFQFEDLCFSFGEHSFCVILPNTELPQAIRQATEFQMKYHPDAVGISARNGRLVEAGRVLKETSRSLEHARTHPSRVVGFRPDPKKYRQFVSEQDS
jgi:GGDEF domain-containing protein